MNLCNSRLLLLIVLLAVSVAALTACGGGGGTPVVQPPPPSDPPEPVDPPANVGPYAINGFEQIPQSMLKVTNEQMQQMWVILDSYEDGVEYEELHTHGVGLVACRSYVVNSSHCDESDRTGTVRNSDRTETSRTGTVPFTEFLYQPAIDEIEDFSSYRWFNAKILKMGTVKLSVHTGSVSGSAWDIIRSYDRPWLKVVGAGNTGVHFVQMSSLVQSWYEDKNGDIYVNAAEAYWWNALNERWHLDETESECDRVDGVWADDQCLERVSHRLYLGERESDCVDISNDGECWINLSKGRWVNADEAHWVDSRGAKHYFFKDGQRQQCVDLEADGACWIYVDEDHPFENPTTLGYFDFLLTQYERGQLKRAFREGDILLAAGYELDDKGNYVRHRQSNNCLGAEEGCLWTRYDFPIGGGTSYSAPQLAAALASVLAVFPDTAYQNLSKFAKACAKKSGQGIEELLQEHGGHGVADFQCMGDVISALTQLPTGGSTNVSVNGQPVTVSGRKISLSFIGGGLHSSLLQREGAYDQNESNTSLDIIPIGENAGFLFAEHGRGELFVAVALGMRNDFFGFADGHDQVTETSFSVGHRSLFATFSEQRSNGGAVIDSARGRSVTLSAREPFSLTQDTSVTVSTSMDKFLGGDATIPVGSIRLNGGGWNHRLSVASETYLSENATISFAASLHSLESGEALHGVNANFTWHF